MFDKSFLVHTVTCVWCRFFSNYYNILELVLTFCCILELLLVTSDLGAFQYEPWGMPFHPYLNRSLLRPLRVIVMTRYFSMQRVSMTAYLPILPFLE